MTNFMSHSRHSASLLTTQLDFVQILLQKSLCTDSEFAYIFPCRGLAKKVLAAPTQIILGKLAEQAFVQCADQYSTDYSDTLFYASVLNKPVVATPRKSANLV